MYNAPPHPIWDTIVIGAGPAGLTAAVYLGRFRRRCIVLHTGDSRASQIPLSHNIPGFPEGVSGPCFLKQLERQAQRFGSVMRDVKVEEIRPARHGFIIRSAHGEDIRGHCILLATGSLDLKPDLPGLADAIQHGVFRICPVCDGFETSGRRVAVVGDPQRALMEARFLRSLGADVAVLGNSFGEDLRMEAARSGICLQASVTGIDMRPDHIRATFSDADPLVFDHLYPAYGSIPRTGLASGLGLALGEGGHLQTDEHQRTSIPGIWAAGDVVNSLSQIAVACGQASIAATNIHNSLLEKEHQR
jgi:thioredoxin reductase (NADPH)